jgi:tryptophan halogenase
MKVVIVGGGSAGWITAALLDAGLNGKSGSKKAVEITLIESAKIGRIGVGEATIPTMRRTLQRIGVSEAQFMNAADASFKQAIKFVNWAENDGHSYIHPFDRIGAAGRDLRGLKWLQSDRSLPFSSTVSVQPVLALEGLAPKSLDQKDYEGVVSYAYHMDAEKFAGFLCDLCVGRGVQHILDDVTGAEVTARGDIVSVSTAEGQAIAGDLFIDCTGFARRLIGDVMGGTFEDFGEWLLCDRAAAAQIPTPKTDDIRPYTTSTGLSAGWCWDIGLSTRRGVGYVYSSAFLSEDEAEAELRAFQKVPDDIPVRHLKFNSGKMKEQWIRNCVSIGLSAGFLEPLESTGLFMVEEGVDYLLELLPRFGEMEASAEIFNRKMTKRYEECLDFINLHYCLTQRRDTAFWREVAKPERKTPSLAHQLDNWDRKPPSRLDFTDSTQLFSYVNYEYILYGMNWAPRPLMSPPDGAKPLKMKGMLAAVEKGRETLDDHRQFLAKFIQSSGDSPEQPDESSRSIASAR